MIMRLLVYLFLLAATVASMAAGRVALALAIAGAKAVVVGLEYMELRHAHRAHAVGFALGMVALVAVLALIASR